MHLSPVHSRHRGGPGDDREAGQDALLPQVRIPRRDGLAQPQVAQDNYPSQASTDDHPDARVDVPPATRPASSRVEETVPRNRLHPLAVDPVLYFDVAEHFILEAGRASGLEFEEYVNDEGIPDVDVLAAPYDIPSVESFVESIMWLTMVATRLSSERPRRVLVWSTLLTVVHTAAYGGPDRPGADSSLYQRRTEKYYPALAQIPI